MRLFQNHKKSLLFVFNIAVIGIVIAVAVSISVLFFIRIYRTNMQSAIRQLDNDLSQINQVLTSEIEAIYNVTGQLADDAQLGQAVDDYYGDSLDSSVQGKKMINYILGNVLSLSASAENIALLCGDRVVQADRYSLDQAVDFTDMKKEEWYQQLLQDEIPFAFGINTDHIVKEGDDEQYYFCATKFKSKFYLNRADETRIVVVTFRMKNCTEQMAAMAAQSGINLLLYNGADGRILCLEGTDPSFLEFTASWGQTVGDLNAISPELVMLSQSNTLSGWELRGFVKRATYASMAYPVQGGLILLLFLLIAVDILFSVTIVRNISKPLRKVIKGMEDIGNQDFYALNNQGQYWEIDQLLTTFNRMSNRIKELIHNIACEEQEKRKMEFRVLENQINPHFIYNTLDATRWVALMNSDKTTANMIASLSKLLRLSLSGGRPMISVQQEIDLTKEYANIMVFRNNYSITFDYQVEEDVEKLMTLKMVLQPLVENCFVHAFSEEKVDAHVIIRCFRKKEKLVMMVIDNGSGITDAPAKPMRDPLLTGIGVHNINERIQLWYGPEFGLEIQSTPNVGTIVIITQPLITEEGGSAYDSSYAG